MVILQPPPIPHNNAKRDKEWFDAIYNKWVKNGHYGTLVLSFDKGRFTNLKENRNRKPGDSE